MTKTEPPTPDQIRAARAALGLTQHQLAMALHMRGVSARQTVLEWEKGERPIPGPAWTAIAGFLEGHRPEWWPKVSGQATD